MKKILPLLIAVMFVFSCNTDSKNSDSSKDEAKEVSKKEAANGASQTSKDEVTKDNDLSGTVKMYDIKSGYIKYKMNIEGMVKFMTLFFKDYGNELAISSETEVNGKKEIGHMLQKDGYLYTYKEGQRQGLKLKNSDDKMENPFKSTIVDEKVISKAGGKKIGTEKFAGKECDVYEMTVKETNNIAKIWLWKGVALKMADKNSAFMEAVEVEETSDFPKGIFDLPESVKFMELPHMKMSQ